MLPSASVDRWSTGIADDKAVVVVSMVSTYGTMCPKKPPVTEISIHDGFTRVVEPKTTVLVSLYKRQKRTQLRKSKETDAQWNNAAKITRRK